MGRVSEGEWGVLFFASGTMAANFQASGNTPYDRELLTMLQICGSRAGRASFSMVDEMLSVPIPLEEESAASREMSCASAGVKSNGGVVNAGGGDRSIIVSTSPGSKGVDDCETEA